MTETHPFTCARCGGEFESDWTRAEAVDEMLDTMAPEHWAEHPGEPLEVVCDDCYDHILGRIRAEAPELLRPEAR